MPWGWIFAQIIGDGRSTKIAKMIVLCWRLTFLWQGQIRFPMHLYGPYTFACICMGPIHLHGKNVENSFWTSPLKTMIQLSWKLMTNIGAPSRHKIAKIDEQPSWKSIFNISSQIFVDLSWNLLYPNRTTSGLKWAKVVLIGNPWWPPQPPYWKSVLDVFSQTTRQIKLKLTK